MKGVVKREPKKNAKGFLKEAIQNIGIMLIAFILSFLILEIIFRIYLGKNLSYDYTNDTQWELKPNQRGFTYPNNKLATINSFGFRGGEVSVDKANNTVRIVLLGDSLAFGYAIGDNGTLSVNLERELQKLFKGREVEVLNGGVPGYGVYQMIALYKKKFKQFKPDIVILSYHEGDVIRQKADVNPFYTKRMFARKLIRLSSFVAYMKPRLNILRQLITGSESERKELSQKFFEMDKRRILSFSQELKRENTSFVLFPWVYKKSEEEFYKKLQDFGESNSIVVLPNYYPYVFGNYSGKRSDLYAEDGHPSEIQNERLAGVMAKDLYAIIINKSR